MARSHIFLVRLYVIIYVTFLSLITDSTIQEQERTLANKVVEYHQVGQSTNESIELDLLQVGSEPVGIRCPHCQEDVMTRATYRNTRITHIVAIVLGIFFWWLCCCLVPYIAKRWKNVEHYCPRCMKFLGVYTRTSII